MATTIWSWLEGVVRGGTTPEIASWFSAAVQRAGQSQEAFRTDWSGAGRRLGRMPLSVPASEMEARPAEAPAFVPEAWAMDEAGRAVLLASALEGTAGHDHLALVGDLYRTGEVRERQALLKSLAFLPDPQRFLAVGVEAVRSAALPVLEAIACDNPYPAAHFPEEAFNQMVLKALFNEIPLRRVLGLRQRRGAELARMVEAYASERRAAGRPVPADAALVLEGPEA